MKTVLRYFIAVAFLSISMVNQAQILNTESFDATQFLPTGWSSVGTTPNWARATTMSAPITALPHTGAGMARFRYPNGGTGASSSETIATPVFDLTGRGSNTVPFSFWIYRDSLVPTNFDTLSIYVNTSTSLTGAVFIGKVARNRSINLPDTKAVNGWYQYTFNIPLQFAGSVNYVLLKGTCYGTSARRIYIDDVEWTAFPPVCSGTPTGGNLSATTTTFCNGTGNTTIYLNGSSFGTGINYQWYTASTQNGPYVPFGFNDTLALSGNLSANQYYFVTVGCTNSGLSMNSDTLTIAVSNSQGPTLTLSFLNDTICRFDTLSMTASGAVSYTWSTGGNPIGTTATIQDVPLNTITYSVVGLDTLGCPSAPLSQIITVGRRPNITAMNNSNPIICLAGSSTLSCVANSGVGGGGGGNVTLFYAWSPNGATTATTIVSPTISTLYTVTVTGQYGCTRTDTTTVIVNPNLISPSITIAPDSLGFCQGSLPGPQILTANSNTPGLTYAWTASGGAPITSTSNVINVTPGNNTITYAVTITDPTNGCTNSASAVIYIFPIPNVNATTPNNTVCLNGSTALTAQVTNTQGTPTSQYTFSWSPVIASTQLVTIFPSISENYYVTVTSPYGCSNLDSIFISVDPNFVSPTLTISPSSLVICSNQNGPVLLVATTNAINPTYQWTPNFINQNNDSITITPNNNLNITVSVSDANGCTSTVGASIVLSAAPTANFTSAVGSNYVVTFTNTSSGSLSYLWDFGDGTTSTQTNPSHTYNSAGSWVVTLISTNADGCSDTTVQTVNSSLVGLEEIEFIAQIYPNPTTGPLHVQFNKSLKVNLSISDASGKVFMKKEASQIHELLDIELLEPGIYFLNVVSNEENKVFRFVKQ